MDSRPEGITEVWERVTELYRSGGVSRVFSGLRTRFLNDVFFRRFKWWQRRGIHVTPVSPWSPVPDTRELDGEVWNGSADLPGIDVNEAEQLSLLSTLQDAYHDDYAAFPMTSEEVSGPEEYFVRNGKFETVDGEVLYGMVRESAPNRIVQVGGGFSTRAIIQAIKHGGFDCRVEVFRPYRDDSLYENPPEQCEFTDEWAESADSSVFDRLKPDDILFVDSTHVIRTGNHVSRLLSQILPRLSSDILVHFHDIFLPYEYPKDWVINRNMSLNEQYSVRAFLEFNARFEVRWMGGYMHKHHPGRLASVFKSYEPSRIDPAEGMNIPNSLWLKTV